MRNSEHQGDTSREQSILQILRDEIGDREADLRLAESRLRQCQIEYDTLVSKLKELRRQEAFWAGGLGDDRTDGNKPEGRATQPKVVTRRQVAESKDGRESHADAARRVLERAGHPLPTSHIIKSLIEEGHPLPTDKAARKNAIYSALWRRDQDFLRVERGVWGLVGRDEGLRSLRSIPIDDLLDDALNITIQGPVNNSQP